MTSNNSAGQSDARQTQATPFSILNLNEAEIKTEPVEVEYERDLHIMGTSKEVHDFNNNLPILQDPQIPSKSMLNEYEGSINEIKIYNYGECGPNLTKLQKKNMLSEVKEWLTMNENDIDSYAKKLKESFEVMTPIDLGPDRGRSVYANKEFKKYEVVGPYAGSLLKDDQQFSKKFRSDGTKPTLEYLFATRSQNRAVSGFKTGNVLSLINTGKLQGGRRVGA